MNVKILYKKVQDATKRRFFSSAVSSIFKHMQCNKNKYAASTTRRFRASCAGLLRRALRQRKNARAFVDLKKSIISRRLPKDQFLPFKSVRLMQRRKRGSRVGT